ncbi:restriction endonuclease subunit S [Schinkia azotoformans]|uniref:restriction endonuclease subunit S n=1 Tax=Schinkia azotoformans TaxID=1454 RepID=UPI002DBECBCA|nr:restriction endonuclease subunit S [Schinkia azotoformans]MEC1719980.1 restriction endonuclease subunit S [Schinkia azotoformans]MED4415688.1 restriction endonuclease subunit S [Schinkia azotoformans]
MVTYPEGWRCDTIKDIANITTGCRDTQDNKVNGRYPFFVRSPIVERIDVVDFDCEAVLTAGDGVGTGKVFHYINGKFAAHQRVYVMSNFQNVDGKYFYYYFSNNFGKEVEKYTAKSSVDSVRRDMIAEMEFPYPPLPEQNEIVKALLDFDEHIDNLTELIEKKKAIRDGALEDLVSGRTRLDGFGGEWKEVNLGTVTTILNGDRGVNYPSESAFTSYGVPFVNAGHLSNGKVLFDGMDYISKEHYCLLGGGKIIKNDILFCLRGSLGKFALADFDEGAPASSLCIVRAKETINPLFLAQLMSSSIIKNRIEAANTGSSQPNLSAKDISLFEFKIPVDIEEQQAISSILTAMDEEIESLEMEKAKMIQIREGAMDDLLTGRVRLTV